VIAVMGCLLDERMGPHGAAMASGRAFCREALGNGTVMTEASGQGPA
jgi:hypothetical protein